MITLSNRYAEILQLDIENVWGSSYSFLNMEASLPITSISRSSRLWEVGITSHIGNSGMLYTTERSTSTLKSPHHIPNAGEQANELAMCQASD